MKIGISACLAGYEVRYDGSSRKDEELLKLLKGHELVPVCPETLASLGIPRDQIEIKEGMVITREGRDLTGRLKEGCFISFDLIKDCDIIILKDKSPSCACRMVFDGSFSGKLVPGKGVFARMCYDKGLRVLSEEDRDEIRKILNV